ncbi:protein-S-isoprenylcysteine O-methyltransferase B [Hibiscus syriacus]|uniref:Protein-S-isoprenylcysteine O-methyltransferase B n=1 Tax=Hibiscus syriacus TaxID=106335 RepID=A0A6A3A9U5_HIBSY|nr:protein-S-isoprenylcysteine O-methyltransferase B [Hibiscus syriacus]
MEEGQNSEKVYDLTDLINSFYIKTYPTLTKIQKVDWNNRGISTTHAIFVSTLSLYFVFWSDPFSDPRLSGLIVFRSSTLSTFGLGVSLGYFSSDLSTTLWQYPALVAYSMFTGEAQLYTYMVLISEVTTPEIHLRWYLDTAGMKQSTAYLINGIVIFIFRKIEGNKLNGLLDIDGHQKLFYGCFISFLAKTAEIARVMLFGYMFYHVYLHYDEIDSVGDEDAYLWLRLGFRRAICVRHLEHDVVWEDY